MSLYSVAKRLTGLYANTPLTLAQDAVEKALGAIYDQCDWSFQKGFAGWLSPGVIFNTGTTTTTPYSNLIIGDGVFTSLVNNYSGQPFLTQLQYRNPSFSVYNIIAVGVYDTLAYLNVDAPGSGQAPGIYVVAGVGDGTGAQVSIVVNADGTVTEQPVVTSQGSGYSAAPTFTLAAGGTSATFTAYLCATLTLDRPWMEPTSGAGQPYMIYQVYYAAPVQDFRKFVEIRDTTNDAYIDFWSLTQADLSVLDPQRLDFSNPRNAVPAGIDQRPGSATLGWQLFELWPQQTSYVPYSYSYRRRGQLPQAASDWMTMAPPYPLTESMVEWRARELLCQYKEAQKGEQVARGSGANWIMLSQMAQKEYTYLLGETIAIDLNLDGQQVGNVRQRGPYQQGSPYATMAGTINLGGYGNN